MKKSSSRLLGIEQKRSEMKFSPISIKDQKFSFQSPDLKLDNNKKDYISEVRDLLHIASDAYQQGDKSKVKEMLNRVSYMALVVGEMQLAKRCYNLLAHAYLSFKNYK